MKAIGGYFELECGKNTVYHPKAIAVNTARNALEYILRTKRYQKIFLPFYTCEVLLEPIEKLGIEVEFYPINQYLEVKNNLNLTSEDVLLYCNYFGIKQDYLSTLKQQYSNLIIDNAQAFFCLPIPNTDVFYSPRKFFGVSDGGYLYTDVTISNYPLTKDISYKRCSHLLKRLELSAEAGYLDFQENDAALNQQPIKQMSALTHRILKNIDYEPVKTIRNENFYLLHQQLKSVNLLTDTIKLKKIDGAMIYPFWIKNGSALKKYLIQHRIFVATYWTNVYQWVDQNEDSLEYQLTKDLIPLPIDQRYSAQDMERIIEVYQKWLKNQSN